MRRFYFFFDKISQSRRSERLVNPYYKSLYFFKKSFVWSIKRFINRGKIFILNELAQIDIVYNKKAGVLKLQAYPSNFTNYPLFLIVFRDP